MIEKLDRRKFLQAGAATSVNTALAGMFANVSTQQTAVGQVPAKDKMIWANLLHLSTNMWVDWASPRWKAKFGTAKIYAPNLRFEQKLWDELLKRMADAGMNMVIIDLGDGVRYQSHPEISMKDAWTIDRLKKELAKMRKMGLEPIPKLNFSTAHDTWLGPYARCVSTDVYYAVCRDLIAEVIELFNKPRFFHLGMDEEEQVSNQRDYEYVMYRQFDLWWRDFYFYVEQVNNGGSRPWIWSDYIWYHPDEFLKKMPKSVVQSNWYYGTDFTKENQAVKAYHTLAEHGYDQIPTGSNWAKPENFEQTVDYCIRHLDRAHLLGFMHSTWQATTETFRKHHMEAIDQAARAISRITS